MSLFGGNELYNQETDSKWREVLSESSRASPGTHTQTDYNNYRHH